MRTVLPRQADHDGKNTIIPDKIQQPYPERFFRWKITVSGRFAAPFSVRQKPRRAGTGRIWNMILPKYRANPNRDGKIGAEKFYNSAKSA